MSDYWKTLYVDTNSKDQQKEDILEKRQVFADYLRDIKESRQLTNSLLAQMAGVTQSYINYEFTLARPPLTDDKLEKLAEGAGLTKAETVLLHDLAWIAEGSVPKDVRDYIVSHETAMNAVRYAAFNNVPDEFWEKFRKEVAAYGNADGKETEIYEEATDNNQTGDD